MDLRQPFGKPEHRGFAGHGPSLPNFAFRGERILNPVDSPHQPPHERHAARDRRGDACYNPLDKTQGDSYDGEIDTCASTTAHGRGKIGASKEMRRLDGVIAICSIAASRVIWVKMMSASLTTAAAEVDLRRLAPQRPREVVVHR